MEGLPYLRSERNRRRTAKLLLYTEKKREEERLEIKLPKTLIDSIREDYKNFGRGCVD